MVQTLHWEVQGLKPRFVIGSLLVLGVVFLINSKPVNDFILSVNTKETRLAFMQTDWDSKIDFLKKKNISPIDAKVDPIWKGIPGYNGLVLDVEATKERMKQEGKWDNRYVIYKEVPPQIQIEQLGPVPIYRGNPAKPMVSIMINVAWGNEYLPSILKTLKENKVKATFFLDGSWTSKFPEEAKKIVMEGHEIGNHAYSHPAMSKLSTGRIEQEILRTNDIIQRVTGVEPTLFAPPSGDYDDRTVKIAFRHHMKTILWTADTVDWKKPTPEQWLQNVRNKIGNGTLILMHPTESTAQALPTLIKEIKQKNLAIGTVSQTISSSRVQLVE